MLRSFGETLCKKTMKKTVILVSGLGLNATTNGLWYVEHIKSYFANIAFKYEQAQMEELRKKSRECYSLDSHTEAMHT